MARSALLAASLLSLGVLPGCPQLLDDSFQRRIGGDDPVLLGSDAGHDAAGSGGASNDHGGGGSSGSRSVGTGVPAALVAELAGLQAHRYRFDGTGSNVLDSVGTAHGTSKGGALLAGEGKITLSGDDQYVELPGGLISVFESVSIECWVNWLTTPWAEDWQILFSFGTNNAGAGRQGSGTRYIYLTPKSGYSNDVRGSYSLTGFDTESFVNGGRALPLSSDSTRGTQVVFVLDGAQNLMSVYIDGRQEVSESSAQKIDLGAIPDVNNWLGRSQFSVDPEFMGELLDVRIYGGALSDAQVKASFDLGPDADL